jgi:hypothetical protein
MLEFLPADVAETLRIAQTAKLTRRGCECGSVRGNSRS